MFGALFHREAFKHPSNIKASRYSIWRQLGHHTMNFTEWRFDEQTRPIPAVSPIQNCTQAMSW